MLAVLALVGQVAYLDALYWKALGLGSSSRGSLRPALFSAVIAGAVVTIVSAVLGSAMALKGDERRGARPLGLSLAAWAYLLAYPGMVVLVAPPEGSLLRPIFEGHFLVIEAIGLAALLRFTAVVPGPLGPGTVRDPRTLPVGMHTAQRLRRWLLRPAAPWIAGVVAVVISFGANALLGRRVEDAPLLSLVDVFRLGALTLVVVNLRHALVAQDETARARIKWLGLGFAVLVSSVGFVLGGNVLTSVTGWRAPALNWRPLVLNAGVLGLLWGSAMAVFYRGPVVPGPVIRRATIMGCMGTVTLFLAAGLEMLLTGVVAAQFTLPYGVGTVLAVVGMGLVYVRMFVPMDRFLSRTWGQGDPTYESSERHAG